MLLRKNKTTILNFTFRIAGLLGKFLLIVFISKELSLADLGFYNLFAVTVAWSVFLVGFEFHSYTLRQIVNTNKTDLNRILSNQFKFHILSCFIVIFLGSVLYTLGYTTLNILFFFISITLLDQLSQEFYRLFIALKKSATSNLIYFIKNGAWVYLSFALVPFFHINLNLVLTFWSLGCFAAFLVGLNGIRKEGIKITIFQKTDFNWIVKGIKTSFPFLISTLTILTISFADRYFIDFFLNKEAVGIYSFFYGIVNIPVTLITSVIVAEYFPTILSLFREGASIDKKRPILEFLFKNLMTFAVFSIGAILFIKPLLLFINKEPLVENLTLFYFMLLEGLIFSFAIIIQTILYAKYKDLWLMFSSVIGVLVNLTLNYILIPMIGLYGATVATLISIALVALLRLLYLFPKIKLLNRRSLSYHNE